MITRCFIVPQPSATGVWSAVTLPPLPQSAPKVIQSYCLSSWFVWSHNITFENRIAQLWMPEAIIVLISSDLHRTQSRKYHLPLFHFLLCGMTTSPAVGVLYSFQNSWPLELQWGKCYILAVANAEIYLNGNEYCYSSFTNQSSKLVFHKTKLMSILW